MDLREKEHLREKQQNRSRERRAMVIVCVISLLAFLYLVMGGGSFISGQRVR